MVDIYEISAVVAAIGVLIGVVYYILDMRHQMQVRQTDLIMGLYRDFGSIEFQGAFWRFNAREYKDFDDYEKQYGWAEAVAIGTFFEGIGLLLKRKLVDIKLVDDLFTTPVKVSWEKMKPIVYDSRRHWNSPAAYEWLEYLYNELKKREQAGVKNG
jgi:alpha-L-fucosidase